MRATTLVLREVFNLTVGPGSRHQYVLPNSQRDWASDLYQRALFGKKFTGNFSWTCPEGGECIFSIRLPRCTRRHAGRVFRGDPGCGS